MKHFSRNSSPLSLIKGCNALEFTFKGGRLPSQLYGQSPSQKSIGRSQKSKSKSRLRQAEESGEKYFNTKTTSSSYHKTMEKSVSSKKFLAENRLILNRRSDVSKLKMQQASDNRKKLSLNQSKQRPKLISQTENLDDRFSGELKYCFSLLDRLTYIKDDQRFVSEFDIFVDILKDQKLGFIKKFIQRLVEGFERRELITQQYARYKQIQDCEQTQRLREQVKQLQSKLLALRSEIQGLTQTNQRLKAKVDIKTVQTCEQSVGVDFESTSTSLDYVLKLEKKYCDSKMREQRFLKVLKILQGKGIDLKEIKEDLADLDENERVSETNLAVVCEPRLQKRNLLILDADDMDLNVADDSVINDSDESSFNFAEKIPQNNFFECRRVYENQKPLKPQLQKDLIIDMDVLYESESDHPVPTV